MAGTRGKPKEVRHRGRRVKTPTVLQMEAVECGAAALGIVLGYYGQFVPLEKLREECGVSRDGSKASNLLKAARKHGMVAKGYRKEPDELNTLPFPLILFWNFNHFIVLEGIRGKKVYLNDPASGPRRVTREELDVCFTGVALAIEPGPEFEKGGVRPGVFKALKGRLRTVRTALAFAVLAGLALVIPGLVIPVFSKVFVDDILVAGKRDWFKPLLLGMALTLLLHGFLTWLQQNALLRQQVKLAVTSSAAFLHHVLRLPYVFFTQRYAGEIGSRVAINDRVAVLLSGELADTFLKLLTICFFSVLMFSYDPMLTLLGILMASLNFLVLTYVSRRRTDLNQRLLQETGKLVGTAMGGLRLIDTIKATGSEGDFFSRWSGYQAKMVNAQQDLSWWTNMVTPFPMFLNMINAAVILGVGGFRIMDGHMTMGMLVAFQSLMLGFMTPVMQLVNLGASFQEAIGNMNRLDDVMCYQQDRPYLTGDEPPDTEKGQVQLSGCLEIRGLTFGYSRLEPPLIEGLDLAVPPGARVAMVGGSGSGKSTIARLMCGLFEPWEGEILFDGSRRGEVPRKIMQNSFAYVDQDILLFEGSVRENLTLWNSKIPDADIARACRDACIHEDIATRMNGYDSAVDEGGSNFSGGQRQRLEIARALVANPSILVLDEATSALDPEIEKRIDENLRRRGCTCIIIAHRLSTIRDCDEIIVLDRGKVAERGLHEELIERDGLYKGLIES
ncbi:MAG: NHLP family bacteriocin export ABC transporter peptidase/permease/ATPase subunit [Desulfobacteraceae bacterium]|nr:MAG: NHLP family bacteriocin export ABC transporter peptidase/permease/ATPase subunit [Desulfobacteraceae bacterium]